jgi:hypothetical protein
MPAATRLLLVDRATPRAIRQSAAALAEQLEPHPAALQEITIRINCHCAVAGRDAELSAAVEAIRERTFVLMRAVWALGDASGRAK